MEFLGVKQVPFARVFTKSDKLNREALKKAISLYDSEMLKVWESLPATFISSTVNKTGRDEILGFIEESFNNLSNRV
jgi:GTP-binding protein